MSLEESNQIKDAAREEVERRDGKIKELSDLVNQVSAQRDSLLKKTQMNFRFVTARYGVKGTWIDVTSMLPINPNPPGPRVKVQIGPQSFGNQDPAPGFIKEFIVCTKADGVFQIGLARDNDVVVLTANNIEIRTLPYLEPIPQLDN